MTAIVWDATGERLYETGVDRGVLYMPNEVGVYDNGVGWNGLTTVTETPSGAEANPIYADNQKYINLFSAEEFGGTIEAYTYPDEFVKYDGGALVNGGITIGQQNRPPFGLSYRTLLGNDIEANDYGYKIHLVYGAQASPSEKAFATVNDSPEAIAFSWEFTTTPTAVAGHKPSSVLTIDSTKVTPANLAALELILYGTTGVDPRLPSPDEVIALFAGSATAVTPASPTFSANVVTIPSTSNVTYYVDGEAVPSGPMTALGVGESVIVTAQPNPGYYFPEGVDNDWMFTGV